jgi:hypothetical protein
LLGNNFGASGARVLIGSSTCSNVVHDSLTPHRKITCQTPVGYSESLPVILVQKDAEISDAPVSIGYASCLLGQSDPQNAAAGCVNCATASYSDNGRLV